MKERKVVTDSIKISNDDFIGWNIVNDKYGQILVS